MKIGRTKVGPEDDDRPKIKSIEEIFSDEDAELARRSNSSEIESFTQVKNLEIFFFFGAKN